MVDKRRVRNPISSQPLIREFLAELAGTFVLVLCIIGTKAQAVLTHGTLAEFMANRMGEGFGVMAGVWIAGGITGGHLNPAMTFGLACVGKVSWKKVPIYWIAQYIGAFGAAACVFGVYLESMFYQSGGQIFTADQGPGYAAIFIPYPSEYLSMAGAIVDSIVVSSLLLICASAIVDQKNCDVPLSHAALYMGFLIMGLGLSFNLNCGVPVNPARDLSPRLFTYLVGWGPQVFSYNNWMWFWIPLAIPHVGAVLGAFIYVLLIEAHWPK